MTKLHRIDRPYICKRCCIMRNTGRWVHIGVSVVIETYTSFEKLLSWCTGMVEHLNAINVVNYWV